MKPTNDNRKGPTVWRKALNLLMWIVIALYFPVIMSFVSSEKAETVCSKLVTDVSNRGDDVMMTDQELQRLIERSWPSLIGTRISDFNLHDMECQIEKSPVVLRCEMFSTPGGVLHVEVLQRQPVMHVFTSSGSYYMDREANRFLAQRDMHANTVVVNGHVNSSLDNVDGLIEICEYIKNNPFWHSQIEQIYVTDKMEFVLVPRVGDHVIEFGKAERVDEKFEDLYLLYKKGWKPLEWNLYKKVNLKYKGQIICTKK